MLNFVGPSVGKVHEPVSHGHFSFLKLGFLPNDLLAVLAMGVRHDLGIVLLERHFHEHFFVESEGFEDHLEATMVDVSEHIDSLLLVRVSLLAHVTVLILCIWVGFLLLFLYVRGQKPAPNHLPELHLAELLVVRAKKRYLALLTILFHCRDAIDVLG